MPRWAAELESVGWPVPALQRSVAAARPPRHRRRDILRPEAELQLVAEVLAPDGPLAAAKVFCRRDVVVAVAPKLFGLDPTELGRVVNRVLADPEALPLVARPTARERAYATATTIATEQAIAALVEAEVARTDAPEVLPYAARLAIAHREAELGAHLTLGQRSAVMAVTTSGRGVEHVVGVAGAGKTTALAAVREAFESEGFEVIGTSTSGQAARTLKRQAGIEVSRTLASLTWRLDHGQIELTPRHVVVVDESAMAEDAALLRLLAAASLARAKVVLVGDHRQLGAVGPGGGFEALVARYGPAVHVLAENVRQRDVADRAALAQLRDGDVASAVASYATRGCIVATHDHAAALDAVVAGWAKDIAAGHQAAMYAWRRANVAELNHRGREVWRSMGRLSGEELVAPGGARYAVGDRVVTLAPGAGGKVVTSETGTVVAVHRLSTSLDVRMDDDGAIRTVEAEEIGAARLAHAYAVTVHRSQGSTVGRAHALEDGGGRELAYVKMSRAKDRSTVYVVADTVDLAVEDLARDWSKERRPTWVIDSGTPATEPAAVAVDIGVAAPMRNALRRGRLLAERHAIAGAVPADPSVEIQEVERRRDRLRRQHDDLRAGRGAYAGQPLGTAVRDLARAEGNLTRVENELRSGNLGRADRRRAQSEAGEWQQVRSEMIRRVRDLTGPELDRLDGIDQQLAGRLDWLWSQRQQRQDWIDRHPEAARRLDDLTAEIGVLDNHRGGVVTARGFSRQVDYPWLRDAPAVERDLGIDL
jgi:hypothetical protein